jgi:hypothetical protein
MADEGEAPACRAVTLRRLGARLSPGVGCPRMDRSIRDEIVELATRAPKNCPICQQRLRALELVPDEEEGGMEYWAACENDHRVRLE